MIRCIIGTDAEGGVRKSMEHELLRKLDIGFGGREKAALEQIRNRARDGSAIASEVVCSAYKRSDDSVSFVM